jgi:Carbamoyltransferase C-terminus
VSGDFAEHTGIPALVNTSMNGANQPIVESPDEALEFFFRSQDINGLILENFLVTDAMSLTSCLMITVVLSLQQQLSSHWFRWLAKNGWW